MALFSPVRLPKLKCNVLKIPHTIVGDLLAPGNVLVLGLVIWCVEVNMP